uniref:K Homology domain-containing protein n=1 Tax=Panagrolaimus sp. JU765 TaxID=591449 RepID=A0AC34QXA7_9BILA
MSSDSLVTAVSSTPPRTSQSVQLSTPSGRRSRKIKERKTPTTSSTRPTTENSVALVDYSSSESSPDAAGGDRSAGRNRRHRTQGLRNINCTGRSPKLSSLFTSDPYRRSYSMENLELLMYTTKEVLALIETERHGGGPAFLTQLNALIHRMSCLAQTLARGHCSRSLSPILKPSFFDSLFANRSPPKDLLSSYEPPRPDFSSFVDQFDTMNVPPAGDRVLKRDKIMVPEHPNYNFIGRILGPRGISVRQLESATGCGILIRGKGSVKNPEREERLRQKNMPGFEHLKEPLHVLITAEGADEAEAERKLDNCRRRIEKLLKPEYDEYKRRQLAQLAMINGNYDATRGHAA